MGYKQVTPTEFIDELRNGRVDSGIEDKVCERVFGLEYVN